MTAAPSRPSPPAHVRARGLWNLLNLATPLGLVGAVVAGCALRPGPHGLIEAHGWTHRFPGGAAFTVGDLMMVSVLGGLRGTGVLDGFPTLAAYVARGETRPAYRRAYDAQHAFNTRSEG